MDKPVTGQEIYDIFFGRKAREEAEFNVWASKAKALYRRTKIVRTLEDELMHKRETEVNAMGMLVYKKAEPVNMRKRAYKKHLKTLIQEATNGYTR